MNCGNCEMIVKEKIVELSPELLKAAHQMLDAEVKSGWVESERALSSVECLKQ